MNRSISVENKVSLPIVDKPLIQYAVEEAEACGIEDFVIITGKNKRAIVQAGGVPPLLVVMIGGACAAAAGCHSRLLFYRRRWSPLSAAFVSASF